MADQLPFDRCSIASLNNASKQKKTTVSTNEEQSQSIMRYFGCLQIFPYCVKLIVEVGGVAVLVVVVLVVAALVDGAAYFSCRNLKKVEENSYTHYENGDNAE